MIGKWPELFKKDYGQLKIIQGPIGYSSITRFIANEIRDLPYEKSIEIEANHSINRAIFEWIDCVTISESMWYPGNSFSKLSSESGYNIVASELKASMK